MPSVPPPAAALLVPSLVFAALALARDAPADWGRAALIAWTALAAAALAGAGGLVAAAALALGFAAVMIGGPPGLAVAALAAAAPLGLGLLLGTGAPTPRWVIAALAAIPALIAARQSLG